MPRRLRSKSLQEWFAGQAVEDLAAFAQSRIEAVYSRIEAEEGKSGATYFAEKLRNDIVPDLMWELYPEAREVVLVRDPRDVLISVLAATRSVARSRRRRTRSDGWGRSSRAAYSPCWRAGAAVQDRTHLVRYEDLMMRPA